LRSWLYRIATNVCIDMLNGRQRRARPMDLGPAGSADMPLAPPNTDLPWLEPVPDGRVLSDGDPAEAAVSRETIKLAFVAALQHLPPRQRAALILCEVLRWKASEAAELLDTSVASVNSALQRARKTVDDKLPERSQQATLRAIGDGKLQEIVDAYMDALARGDVARVVSMLAEDAAWSMPPLPTWFSGHDGITDFLRFGPLSGEWRWRHLPARVNGQVTSAAYQWSDTEQAYLPFALDVITFEGDRIKEVTAFITRMADSDEREFYARWPDQPLDRVRFTFERFGLPGSLPEA
jgi:RNA polymerase sigma-70 factor, ECF subfamily